MPLISPWICSRSIGVMKVRWQAALHLGGDPVGGALGRVDRRRVLLACGGVAVVLHHRQEGTRTLDYAIGVLVEQLEEIAFPRQQLAEHLAPPGPRSSARLSSCRFRRRRL